VTPKLHTPGIWTPQSVEVPRRRLRPDRMHLFDGFGQVVSPEGDILAEDPEWIPNALHDAGEQTMLNVFLKEQANVTKYLGLLNDASVAETDGTMTAVTETQTPAANGYNRQQIVNTDWTDDGLVGGDYRFSAAQKTFGPATATWTLTHASLSTTLTTAGVLLVTVATVVGSVPSGSSYLYTLRWTQQ
jgi:hypothetical protein